MTTFWIIHRDPHRRAGIARLAGVGDRAVAGSPTDPVFDSAPAADVVLMGPTGDFEAELEFVNRYRARLFGARWILVPDWPDLEETRRLFDTVRPEILRYPPDARILRARIADTENARTVDALSARRARSGLADRFGRWFADLEIPELLRAVDPALADVSLIARGEPGTGKALLVRYVHAFGGTSGGALAHVVCGPNTGGDDIAAAIAAAEEPDRARPFLTVWLDGIDRLAAEASRRVVSWVEHAPPAEMARAERVRWVGTADDREPALESDDLSLALGALTICIPPLRERVSAIAPFVAATAGAWCGARGAATRRFGEDALAVLEENPWPGNLRELEAVVIQTLAAGALDPVRADDLRLGGQPFAPLDTTEIPRDEPRRDDAMRVEPPAEAPPVPAILDDGVTPEASAPEARAEEPARPSSTALRRLAGALAHEVRNPLSTVRTFAELLPERYGDSEFRDRFSEIVTKDVARISDVLDRLEGIAALTPPRREPVDVTFLLEELFAARRDWIRQRRLLVLKELESDQPVAFGDRDQLRFALEALLNKSLDLVPERGEMYVASKHHPDGLRGGPSLRILVRLRGRDDRKPSSGRPVGGLSPAENALEFAFAEAIVQAQGGELAVDASDADETVLIVDIPAAA